MRLERLKKVASSEDRTETVSFRLTAADKNELLLQCSRHNLSLGAVLRELVKDFLEEVKK